MLYRELLKVILQHLQKKYKFVYYKPTILIRVCDDTLHIINFDLPSEGLNCNIAIQPLYILSDTITISFGNCINHFKAKLPGIWGYSNDKNIIEKDFSQIKDLLEINAIPWFNEVGRPEGIISFIESGLSDDINIIVGFPPALRSMYLRFSYLYNNKMSFAEKTLTEVVEQCKEDKRTWVVQKNKMINDILILAKNEPNKISAKLNEYVKITKDNLKIKI